MLQALPGGRSLEAERTASEKLEYLQALERKVLWLSTWMIHNANHLRPSLDGLKVGGHQASSASVVTLMTALYLDVMRPQDRVAVKPHAAPVFHALQYLLGHQTQDKLERFRALGGAQSYPSRTKDGDIVDFSTGSVGLGVGVTLFASLVQDYLRLKRLIPSEAPPKRDVQDMVSEILDLIRAEANARTKSQPLNLFTANPFRSQNIYTAIESKPFVPGVLDIAQPLWTALPNTESNGMLQGFMTKETLKALGERKTSAKVTRAKGQAKSKTKE